MDAERWRRINELFHAALEHAPHSRDAFLDTACAGDAALREEVQALLRMHTETSVVDRPAAEADPDLLPRGEDEALIGRQLGPYEVTSLLGRGGMGVVYLGFDTRLQRPVAIKALPPAFTSDDRLRARLRREAMAAAALTHPGVATVFALEEFEGDPYLVHEYVPGRTLRATMQAREGDMPVEEVVTIALDIARALAAAHAHGIIHRDLKPENVMHTPGGGIKVVDFGLARFEQGDGLPGHERLTGPGVAPGTPGYMAPEMLRGDPVDARSDQFSFGVLLYELVAGRHPFEGTDDLTTVARILDTEPSALDPPWTPGALERVITTCLAKWPRDRYRTTDALVTALEAALDASRRQAASPATDAGARAARRSALAPAGESGARAGESAPTDSSDAALGTLPGTVPGTAPGPAHLGSAAPRGASGQATATAVAGATREVVPGTAPGRAEATPPAVSGTAPHPAAADSGGKGRRGAGTPLWWWQFHQVAVSVVYVLTLYPVWRVREWLPDVWGLVAFMTAVAVVGAAVNLRLHLWFTSRVYPDQLGDLLRQSSTWRRLSDSAFSLLLLATAAVIAPEHPRWAAFFIVLAISGALSARVMEPATTRAAFPPD